MNKKKNKSWLLPLIILCLITIIPSAWALYHIGVESPMTTTFVIEYDSVFVRAHVITYWEEIETGNTVAKTSWNINEEIINEEWTKIGDYYYYNGTFTREQITDGVPTENELIAPELTSEEVSNEDLTDLKNVAKYKIIYEIIEAKAEENILSCEDAWGITYSSEGTPSKKNE